MSLDAKYLGSDTYTIQYKDTYFRISSCASIIRLVVASVSATVSSAVAELNTFGV